MPPPLGGGGEFPANHEPVSSRPVSRFSEKGDVHWQGLFRKTHGLRTDCGTPKMEYL
jgi:hypothetical protein